MLTKSRLYWTIQIGGWALYALIEIITRAVATGLSTEWVVFLTYEALCCLVVTHSFRLVAIRRRWLGYGLTLVASRILFAVLVMSVSMYFLRIPAILALGIMPEKGFEEIFSPVNLIGLSAVYAVIFFLWITIYFAYHYFDQFNQSLKLEASVREIELNNLKSQLNPHFIFNALNSIRALIDEDPLRAKRAVTQLSNLLRSSLTSGKSRLTPLEDELKIVRDYLGLEMIRFEDRLATNFDIGPESSEFSVPPLMIQTLVENGIKHGVSRLKEGGIIEVKTRVHDDRINIQIRNSGQYVNGKRHSSAGLGIDNTRQRLKLIFGDEATFTIKSENDRFVLTEIELPYVR